MRKKSAFSLGLLALTLVSCVQTPVTKEVNLTNFVDQRIGTGGHGHVFMGANVPFGLVQLGPTSIPQTWDWCSGYHISDTTVIGFSHLHLSGTGIGDLSDISIMPTIGDVKHARGTHESYDTGLWSYFSRVNERFAPGYYATRLDRFGVDVELTATPRVGFHKYTFPNSDDARILIDLDNGTCWDAPVETYIKVLDDRTVEGYRFSKGWAKDQRIFFRAEFSEPFTSFKLFESDNQKEGTELTASRVYGQAHFNTKSDQPIYLKVALSPVSTENALMNMNAEAGGWDFEATRQAALLAWNNELSRVNIETNDESVKKIFYTALYHTMVAPSVFADVNGDYLGTDKRVYTAPGFVNYTTFSLWDTYRAAHPLMTIIHPERVPDMINTMLNIYKQQGKLPVWHLMGCETDCMVGNPGIPVVADAVLKGYAGFDYELAYEAMKNSAMLDERGMNYRKQYGYIPYDTMHESVAFDMEYALADWALAQVAQKLNKQDDYAYFLERSKSYRHYFDKSIGFMRGKGTKGEFHEPFNPVSSTHRFDDFCEGNSWQYTFLVPHDVEGLKDCFGSEEAFVMKLDSLFTVDSTLAGNDISPDISGLIGQYAHGNEPSHHILYMYSMIGQPWKAAKLIRQVLDELYHDQPDGLSGNEDVGQMSAWYVLSSLGLYQLEPAGGRYFFGSPIVDRAELRVKDGKTFTIIAHNNSATNMFIQSVKLNGQSYNKRYIDFADIAAGATLEFEMGDKEGTIWW